MMAVRLLSPGKHCHSILVISESMIFLPVLTDGFPFVALFMLRGIIHIHLGLCSRRSAQMVCMVFGVWWMIVGWAESMCVIERFGATQC